MYANPNAHVPRPNRQATAREFLAVVFRRKWLILGLFVVTTVTVLTIAFTTPVSYVSSGRVLVKRGEQQSAITGDRRVFSDWEQDLGSEVEVVKSASVTQRARDILVERAKHGAASRELHVNQVDIEVMGKTNVIALAYNDLNPDVAQEVCDALIHAYVDFRDSRTALTDPQGFFKSELARVEHELDAKSELRRAYGMREGVVDVAEQNRNWLMEQSVQRQRRTEIAVELADAQATSAAMQRLSAETEIDVPTLGAPSTNEDALIDLKRKIVDQETRLAQLRERYRDDSAEVQNAQETVDTLRGLLKREVNARVRIADSRIDVLKSRLAIMDRDIAQLGEQLSTMPNKSMSIAEMDREIAVLKQRYSELSLKADQAKVTENTSPSLSVVLLSPAGSPIPKNTRDYVRMALAPAFSLIVGIGLAFFIDGLDLTIRTAHHAEEALELPVLASISEQRKRG